MLSIASFCTTLFQISFHCGRMFQASSYLFTRNAKLKFISWDVIDEGKILSFFMKEDSIQIIILQVVYYARAFAQKSLVLFLKCILNKTVQQFGVQYISNAYYSSQIVSYTKAVKTYSETSVLKYQSYCTFPYNCEQYEISNTLASLMLDAPRLQLYNCVNIRRKRQHNNAQITIVYDPDNQNKYRKHLATVVPQSLVLRVS